MTPRDVLELVKAQPFEPSDIVRSTGERLAVRHPENLIVGMSKCYFFEYVDGIAVHPVHVSLRHSVKMEPLDGRKPDARKNV